MPFLQGGAYSHRHSLLAHIGILEAGNETLPAQVSSPLLEPADHRHRRVELDHLILVHAVICHWPVLILDVLFGGWFRLGSQLLPQLSAGLTSSIKQRPRQVGSTVMVHCGPGALAMRESAVRRGQFSASAKAT